MTDPILSAFSYFAMRDMCEEVSWSHSMHYGDERRLGEGRVGELTVSDGRLAGTVDGLVPHTAQLWVENGGPRWSCTCPVAVDGLLCGHCVAVVDMYEQQLTEQGLVPPEPDVEEEYLQQDERLRQYLHTLDVGTLAELVLEQTMVPMNGWRLTERLIARAASAAGSAIDPSSWRDRLEYAFATGDYVERDRTARWTHEVHDVVEALDGLTDLGQGPVVIELYEHACGLLDQATTHVDDSLNWLEGPRLLIGEFHHRACEATRPDPIALAGRLVELELRFPSGVFYQAAVRYAGLLGAEGLAEYQRLLELRRDAIRSGGEVSQRERDALTKAMVGVALASGDPDQLIAAKKHDMVLSEDYCEVASMLAGAGRLDEAVDWVQRGLAPFGKGNLPWKSQSAGLYELLAVLHRRRGDANGTTEALWRRFVVDPSLQAYQRMLREPEIAVDAGTFRRRAVKHLRVRDPFDVITGRSVLPEILAYEGDFDEAWAVAAKDGCDRQLRLVLVRTREQTHPKDAISVYEEEVDSWLASHEASRYRQAILLMTRIERVYDRLDRHEDFTAYVVRMCVRHHDKLRFAMMLTEQGWWPVPLGSR